MFTTNFILKITFLWISLTSTFALKELPDFLHICSRNDPDLDACITKSVEMIKPKLNTGLPEFNIPSLEPLVLEELIAAEGTGGIKVAARNVKAYGASNFMVQKIRADLSALRFAVDVLLPHLYIDGEYIVEGRVLLLPLRGNGILTGNFTDATGACKIIAELVKSGDGTEYFHISEFRMRIAMRKGSIYLTNLFGGDPTLGNVINNAINSNFDAFIKELQPIIEKTLSEYFLKLANAIVKPYTFDQLFPA